MEEILKKLIKNDVRKSILKHVLKKGPTCPEDLSNELNISKGMPSQFLKHCASLNIVKRERIGHKVYYSVIPEHYLKIYNLVSFADKKTVEKKKVNTEPQKKDFQMMLQIEDKKTNYDVKKLDNEFGGSTYVLNDEKDGSFEVFKTKDGVWWCVSCQKQDCEHVKYLRKQISKT